MSPGRTRSSVWVLGVLDPQWQRWCTEVMGRFSTVGLGPLAVFPSSYTGSDLHYVWAFHLVQGHVGDGSSLRWSPDCSRGMRRVELTGSQGPSGVSQEQFSVTVPPALKDTRGKSLRDPGHEFLPQEVRGESKRCPEVRGHQAPQPPQAVLVAFGEGSRMVQQLMEALLRYPLGPWAT